jgi:hypothetical protein
MVKDEIEMMGEGIEVVSIQELFFLKHKHISVESH